jgi:hypothetical protein
MQPGPLIDTEVGTRAVPSERNLWVTVRREADGPELTREPVVDSDLSDARSELWMFGFLRRGFPEFPLDAVQSRLVPLRKEGGPKCSGFALEAENPRGETCRLEFSIHALETAAQRGLLRLREHGQIGAEDSCCLGLVEDTLRRPSPAKPVNAGEPFSVTAKNPPLSFLEAALPPLLERARQLGPLDERCYPVFYTEEAFERAERFARRGGRRSPPIETGAVLIGPLCSCPETGELFAVVAEALEVQEAEEQEFSLTYSGRSWTVIQGVLRARQQQPDTQAHRALGQCHGHNFPPSGGEPPCEICFQLPTCSRTSVFVSQADRTWSRAVFARQPWQLCHIFGWNGRNEAVHNLYGLRDGRLLERGFYLLPEFRPIV